MNLVDVTEGFVCQVPSSSRGVFSTTRRGEVVPREVAIDLWTRISELPMGEQARCHIPRFGLALGYRGEYHWFATICWECNNIYVSCDGMGSLQQFNSQSHEARQLLGDVKSILHIAPEGA